MLRSLLRIAVKGEIIPDRSFPIVNLYSVMFNDLKATLGKVTKARNSICTRHDHASRANG
jgi:hypothetical protein